MRKKILLIEPGYPNKYPPLGLMKLAAYHGPSQRNEQVRFIKGPDPEALKEPWDRVYVTTLFSFEWKRTAEAIDFAIRAAGGQKERVFVGGIAASLMHDQFVSEQRWVGVRFIKGLLDGPPATALQLSEEDDEFGSEDTVGTPIEELIPDYSILDQVNYCYPVVDAYFGYASRGCVRKCSFCGVPQLEGPQREMPGLGNWVNGVKEKYGEKKDLILMDNNITAAPRYKEIIAEIIDLGFGAGATIPRNGNRRVKRRVDFNQGVDARILCKSPMYLQEMSKVCISPLRIAFDHIGVRKQYETAVRMAEQNEIRSLSNYMLYNFMDTPDDLYQRMRINISLNQELGISIWSFPMRYQPVNLKDRSHVGRNWNRYYLRSFQIMLQPTHGIVSGKPEFFDRAYGKNQKEFGRLLSLPHAFLFHRDHFEFGKGKGLREEYESLRNRMSESQERELLEHLAGPSTMQRLNERRFSLLAKDSSLDGLVKKCMEFHALGSKDEPATKTEPARMPVGKATDHTTLGEEEIVEDAGLFEQEETIQTGRSEIRLITR